MKRFNHIREIQYPKKPKPSQGMKKINSPLFVLLLVMISISIAHCSKTVEELQKNFVIDVMTKGKWTVQVFTENSADFSSEFTPYEFQFFENGNVQGIRSGAVANGTWAGDAGARTIFSIFPAANDTITKLNDTWKITNSTATLVEARPFNTGRNAYLKLVKK
jgi:hypothetical protein